MITERSVEIPWAVSKIDFYDYILDVGGADSNWWTLLPNLPITIDQRKANIPNFIQADVINLPFPDNTFDIVTCISTYEHFGYAHEPYGTVDNPLVAELGRKEMLRVLKPNGKLLITVPFGKQINYKWFQQFDWNLFVEHFGIPEECSTFILKNDAYLQCSIEELTTIEYDTSVYRARGVLCAIVRKHDIKK